jgi:bifunctional lysine-specific demethylase and histidyl-hydroxylase NO66
VSLDPLTRATGLTAEQFAARHWARRPLLTRATERPGDDFGDLLSLAAVDELVSRRGLRTPFLRMAKEGDVLGSRRFTRGGGAGADIADQAADDKILAEFADGATLVLQGLHRMWPPMVTFASKLSEQLGHPVQVNAYITPAQNRGFAPHYDVHDVFVLQFAGRKHWTVHEPVLEAPLRSQPWDDRKPQVAEAAQGTPVIDTVLEPGDALYLPRGYLHSAAALGEVSGHLTIGVHPVTRSLLAQEVLTTLGDDLELRRSLPMGVDLADPSVLDHELKATREALHAAIDRLDVTAVAAAVGRHLSRSTRPQPIAPLGQLAAAETVTAASLVSRREGLRCVVQPSADAVKLLVFDKTVTLPVETYEALDALLSGAPVAAGSLPALDEADSLTLTRRLLREGVVVPVQS